MQELQGADIQNRGLGKRRLGEREFEAIPNPWPGPRGSDFRARPPTRWSGERLLGVLQPRAARGPSTKAAAPRLPFFRSMRLWFSSEWDSSSPEGPASPLKGEESRARDAPTLSRPLPLESSGCRRPPPRGSAQRGNPSHWCQAHPSGFKELLSGLAAAATPLFSLPHCLAEAAAARPEIAVASGSLSPQPNPRPPLFPPSCFSAPPPPIPDRVSTQHADKGVKANTGQ